jgi:hypothetical protein
MGDGVNATEKRNMIICVTNLSELTQLHPMKSQGGENTGWENYKIIVDIVT